MIKNEEALRAGF